MRTVFINSLFREQALARRQRQEPLDDRLQVTSPHEWLLVAALAVAFLALLVYAFAGSVERSASYDAVVVLPGERHPVSAPASGTVVEVLAAVGDTVEPEQVIARVRTAAAQQGDSSADIVSVTGGELMALDLTPGGSVSVGESVGLVRIADSGPPEALALVPSDDVWQIEAGMAARVSIAQRNRQASSYRAEVSAVSERAVAPPEWLEDLGMSAPTGTHLVRVPLRPDGMENPIADGTTASLRLVLGRSPFLSLLVPGDSS